MIGPHTNFPVAGRCNRQGCVSHSTPEAEMVAMDYAVRMYGIPFLSLLDVLFPERVVLRLKEDNDPMIRVLTTGRNPTMRYLNRTHRLCVGWLHEVACSPRIAVHYEPSQSMRADIYTKGFQHAHKWATVRELVNVLAPPQLTSTIFPNMSRAVAHQGSVSSSKVHSE